MSIKSINQIAFDFCSFYFLVSIRPANHILLISTKFLNPSKTVTTEVIRSPYLYPKVQENRNNHINHHQTNRIMNILSSVFNKNMMVGKKKEEENNLFSGFRKEDILPGTIITVPVLYL